MLLLVMLPLVLGGALLSIAMIPVGPGGSGTPDAAVAAALASAVARGQDAIVDSADGGPLARMLTGSAPTSATTDKARASLDALAVALGDPGAVAALLDPSGRVRLARGGPADRASTLLPGRERDLARVLQLRTGALVVNAGRTGRTVVFAAPVRGQGGEAQGVLVASVPIASLLAADGRTLPDGAIALGSVDGATWSAVSTAGLPLSRQTLLLLALLSLLAVPFAWLAGRAPRRHRGMLVPANAPIPTGGRVAVAMPMTPSAAATPTSSLPAPVQAQRLPAYALAASAAAEAATASVAPEPAHAAPPPPIQAPPAEAASVKRGRFGRARKVEAVSTPLLVEPSAPATPAASPDELLDALTGLGNHRGFGEELDRLMVSWQRTHVPFALLLVDIDDLKITNARAGHAAGDELLKVLGRQVRTMLRYSDRAFRIGGDEIAVLMPHTDAAGAVQLGQRLLTKVRGGGGEPALAFCAGAAAFPGPAQDRDQLLDQAGAALAWGKSHGRASVLAYDPITHSGQTDAEKVAQAAAVAQVIAERSLRAVFQPIVDMTTGEVVGYEGLTRPGPGAPFTNPGLLFEAAEAVGRTVELDAACFETISEGARAIPRDRVVSINLSPRTMEAADFSVAGVLAMLADHDLDPGRVILELTERETVLDLDRLRDNLAELQRAGVRIAADDVGAGNAGLRLLSQFRFDIVKVDLSLVQEGANNDASRAVLRSLRDLAQRWGAFVIAEGIETPTQLRVVRELGLAAGQGYLIGRPGSLLDLPPVDLVGLEQGGLMLQNAPVPSAAALPHGSPA